MSVTFWIPEAPKKHVPCEWCEKAREARSATCALDGKWVHEIGGVLTDEQWARVTCDPWCPGGDSVSELPEANFANANALALLPLMGLQADYSGSIKCAAIPAVQRAIMRALNVDTKRAHLVREPTDGFALDKPAILTDRFTGIPTVTRGPRVMFAGNTDAQTCERLRRVQAVLAAAAAGGFDVQWD